MRMVGPSVYRLQSGWCAALLSCLILISCGPPPDVVEWVDRQVDQALFQVETREPLVALTIDDGPDDDTAAILDVLKKHSARATFFVIGQDVEKHPDLTERILAEGHELGHHTMTHQPGVQLPIDTFETRFLQMDSLLAEYGGSKWYRPADGIFTPAMHEVAEGHGYTVVLGSIYPVDPANPLVPYLAGYIIRYSAPGDIIILHTGQGRGARTAAVLDRALPDLKRRGLQIVTLSELVRSSTSCGASS